MFISWDLSQTNFNCHCQEQVFQTFTISQSPNYSTIAISQILFMDFYCLQLFKGNLNTELQSIIKLIPIPPQLLSHRECWFITNRRFLDDWAKCTLHHLLKSFFLSITISISNLLCSSQHKIYLQHIEKNFLLLIPTWISKS